MAKTTAEKLLTTDEKITQLMDERKQLIQKQKDEERKKKNSRFNKRHGLLESMLPEIIGLTDEQYKTFLERAVANDTVRKIIKNITTQNVKPIDEKHDLSSAQNEDSGS